jgi:hypothetical protein
MKSKGVAWALLIVGVVAWPLPGWAGLVSQISVWGEATDLTPGVVGQVYNLNRLGGWGSDICYDQASSTLWAVQDRGVGPGTIPYNTRLQKFHLDVDPATGAMSNFQLQATVPFMTADGSQHFDGRTPLNLHGNSATLGLSFDPEGIAVRGNTVYVADEYGPSVYQFNLVDNGGATEARFVRAFSVPARYTPMDSTGSVNYDAKTTTTPASVSGRQSGRGLESLALSPSGNTLWTCMQDPLVNEGDRNSRNVRLLQFDVASGACTAEYAYQLESIASINQRIPVAAAFKANQQGRNISVNGLFALSDDKLLVLERDNRGIGTGNPLGADPVLSVVGTKRVMEITLAGATDIRAIDIPSTGVLPAGVVPVNKNPTPVLDIQRELENAGVAVPEKFEGISLVPLTGPQPFAILAAVDNDYSAYDDGLEPPSVFDIYTPSGVSLPVGSPIPVGDHLMPTHLMTFAAPEPGTYGLFMTLLGAGAVIGWMRRRHRQDR